MILKLQYLVGGVSLDALTSDFLVIGNQILYLVENHPVTVIIGQTGSGKTTQIPQYLHEVGWSEGGRTVVCTQPRRVAATSIASRVAEERSCQLGEEVSWTLKDFAKVIILEWLLT